MIINKLFLCPGRISTCHCSKFIKRAKTDSEKKFFQRSFMPQECPEHSGKCAFLKGYFERHSALLDNSSVKVTAWRREGR